MHRSVRRWVEQCVNEYALWNANVLEVGSYDENGSVRDLFSDDYTGVDMRQGPGVDIVANAHKLPFEDEVFDVVVSTEMLEHDHAFWLSLAEMGRVLKERGYLILTARGNGFPEHAFPHDYYRFMPESAECLVKLANCEFLVYQKDRQDPGIFVVGQKYANDRDR